MTINKRKVQSAHNHMVWVIERLGQSGLGRETGDSLLIDDANKLRQRIVANARRAGINAEAIS
ncbi:MAG: hypothetical protein NUW01_13505 [Gemmatimonadaceae bacterium]|nr:hypothetical protein [Gemmatimonadaceae bacterium]